METTPMNLEEFEPKAEAMVADGLTKAGAAMEWASALVVANQADVDSATVARRGIKSSIKIMEDARKFLVEPLKQHAKRIDSIFKAPREKMEEADRIANRKTSTYLADVERERFKEQQRLAREAEKVRRLHETLATKAVENGDMEKAQEQLEKSHAVQENVAAVEAVASEGSNITRRWKGEVTDLKAVVKGLAAGVIPWDPDLIKISQKVLDEKARAIKNTVKWPGILFSQDFGQTIRR